MLKMPIFGPKFPFAPSIMSIVYSIVVHCRSSQKWSSPQSGPPTFGPYLHAPSKPIFIFICDMTCILSIQPSMPPPRHCRQKLVMVLEPPMSSPHELAKMVDIGHCVYSQSCSHICNPYFIYPFDKLWPPWPFTWGRVLLDVGLVGTKPILN